MQEELSIYPLVKAYPVMDASSKSEAVCVAGVTVDKPRRWVRLFPLDFRGLDTEKRFKKYQQITLRARRSRQDSRPESMTPELASITIGEEISTDNGTWRRRLELIEPLIAPSLCEIQRRRAADGTSLGIFRPAEISDLVVEPADPKKMAEKRGLVEQQSFFDQRSQRLEPLPIRCRYVFRCDDTECSGHRLTFIDWEMGALVFRLVKKGASFDVIEAAVRKKFLYEVCAPSRDVLFIVGNLAAHQGSFLVIGAMWPPRSTRAQGSLFQGS